MSGRTKKSQAAHILCFLAASCTTAPSERAAPTSTSSCHHSSLRAHTVDRIRIVQARFGAEAVMAMTWPFLVYYGSTGGAVDPRRARSDCLLESAAFQRAEPCQRVVTSQFRPHGFGPYPPWVFSASAGAKRSFHLHADQRCSVTFHHDQAKRIALVTDAWRDGIVAKAFVLD